jgi:hypothetical protein
MNSAETSALIAHFEARAEKARKAGDTIAWLSWSSAAELLSDAAHAATLRKLDKQTNARVRRVQRQLQGAKR